MRVYGYIQNCGDGSNAVTWVEDKDRDKWNDLVDRHLYDAYTDGDGLTDRVELIFDSREAAEAAGIKFKDVDALIKNWGNAY